MAYLELAVWVPLAHQVGAPDGREISGVEVVPQQELMEEDLDELRVVLRVRVAEDSRHEPGTESASHRDRAFITVSLCCQCLSQCESHPVCEA